MQLEIVKLDSHVRRDAENARIDDEWILPARTLIERRFRERVYSLANEALARALPSPARRLARLGLGVDPIDEDLWALVVRAAISEDDFDVVRSALAEARATLGASNEAFVETAELDRLARLLSRVALADPPSRRGWPRQASVAAALRPGSIRTRRHISFALAACPRVPDR